MYKQKDNVSISNAEVTDVELLAAWWDNGKIMAHAGFPNGLKTDKLKLKKRIEKQLLNEEDDMLIIIRDREFRVGETHYRKNQEGSYIVGMKICDFNLHSKGIGTKAFNLLLELLFIDYKAKRVHLDTNLNNLGAQRFYEKLGFIKYDQKNDVWKDQEGNMQSSVFYEMTDLMYQKRTI